MQDQDQDAAIVDGEAVAEIEDSPLLPPPSPPPAPPHGVAIVSHTGGSTNLIAAATAAEKVAIATEIATALDHVIKAQGMRTKVGSMKKVRPDGSEEWVDKYHVNVEAWQTLATFLDLAVVPVYCRPVNDPATGRPLRTRYTATVKRYHPKKSGGGLKEEITYDVDGFSYEARVEVYKDGALISAAIGLCTREEQSWSRSDDFALSGMAQTRATSRAIAQAARWIVALAGYSGTPAEEHGVHEPEPGGPPAEPGPEHGPQLNDDQIGKLRRAIAYVLDCDPLNEKVAAVLGLVEKKCGYVSYAAFAAIGVLCAAIKTDRELSVTAIKRDASSPAAGPAAPAEDDIPFDPPAPDWQKVERAAGNRRWHADLSDMVTAAKTQTAKLAVLRNAGCECDDPVMAHTGKPGNDQINDQCPVHGIPF